MPNEILGDRLFVSSYSIQGALEIADACTLIQSVVDAINMTPAHNRTVCQYPVGESLGGIGFTVFQPITESFLVLDAWPKATAPHAYLVIGSCKPYASAQVVQAIQDAGYSVHESFSQSIVGCP
jgi:hypothetical protein